jgi:coenzyme F420 hydrogenase subunit delta
MIEQLFEKSILVFGCGNILLGDDGFGPAVVDYLRENYSLPEEVLVMDVGTGIRDILFDLTLSDKKPQKIIIVDAVNLPNKKPGEVFEIPMGSMPENKTSDFSLHQFPTVNLLTELQNHTSIQVKIIVAQTGEIPYTIKPGLTKVMQEAIEKACRRILPYLSIHSAD